MKLFIQKLSILSLVAACYATSFRSRRDSSDSDDEVPYQGSIQGDLFFNGGTHEFGNNQITNGRGGTQENITGSINATAGASVIFRNVQTNMPQGNPKTETSNTVQTNRTSGIHASNGAIFTYSPTQTTYSNGQQQWSQSHGQSVDISFLMASFFGAELDAAPNVPTERRDTPQSANTRDATASGINRRVNGVSSQTNNVGSITTSGGGKINIGPVQRNSGGGRGIQTTSIQNVEGSPDSIIIDPTVINDD